MGNPTRRNTVLIILSDHNQRVRLRKSCEERHGLHVETAANPKEALTILKTGNPPLFILLSSEKLPVMSFEEFLETKSKDAQISGIPVVLLSKEPVSPLPKTVAGEVFRPLSNRDIRSLLGQFGGQSED